jgi:hypothetical protein
MITRAFFHLSKRTPEPDVWLEDVLSADSVEVVGISGDDLTTIARKNDKKKHVSFTGTKLLERLENDASDLACQIAWLLLCFYDTHYDTDAFFRDYVHTCSGLRIEDVPFFSLTGYLHATCAKDSCTGKLRKTDKLNITVDKDKVTVLIPLSDPEIRELLFSRLRRISQP